MIRFWPHPKAREAQEFAIGPAGDWLSVRFGDSRSELWPVETNRAGISIPSPTVLVPGSASYLAVREKALYLVSLNDGTGRRILEQPVNSSPFSVDRTGERVFAMTGDSSHGVVARLSDGQVLANLSKVPRRVTEMDWSPDGRWIALADGEPPYAVTLYDSQTGEERSRFVEHLMLVRLLRFHPDSASFAAVGDGHQLIWRSVDPDGFRVEIPAASHALEFSKDGSRLGYSPGDSELGILSVVGFDAFRAWPEPPRDQTGAAYTAAFSKNGQWAAVASDKSLRIWDARKQVPVDVKMNVIGRCWWSTVFFTLGPEPRIIWSPLGTGIWSANVGVTGALHSMTNLDASPDTLVQELAEDGRSMVVIDGQVDAVRAVLRSSGDPAKTRILGRGIPFAGFRLLPDGKTGFSTHFTHPDLWLWNTATGDRIRSLGLAEPVASEPSPDGRWLLTGTRTEHRVWDTQSWKTVARWASRTGERDVWAPAFSPDSTLLAKASPVGEIVLRRIPSGEEIVTLTPPRPIRLQQITFAENGAKLMLLQATGRIYEWSIALLRAELGKLGLGW